MTAVKKETVKGPDTPAPPPSPSQKPFPKHQGPGFGEVKPHNVAGIWAGLAQLGTESAKLKRTGNKIYLVTYTYGEKDGKNKFTGFLLEPNDESLKGARKASAEAKLRNVKLPLPKVGDKQAWLKTLGDWWELGEDDVPNHPFREWGWLAGAPAIGSMLEDPLRKKFIEKYKPISHITDRKRASGHGVDIDFLEIAEFLYELEAALDRVA
jgi:hypothetical protein